MSSGCRSGLGGSGGPALTWRPSGPIWSATVGEGGAGLWSPPSGLGWAGVLQCVRPCGLASAGGPLRAGCIQGPWGGGWLFWGVRGGRVLATGRGGRASGRGAPLSGCVRVVECGGCRGVSGGWVCGGRVLLFGRLGEACVAGPGDARDGWRVWVSGWAARGEGHGRGLRGGVCCVGVCVRSQRRAWFVSCRLGGLEEKLAVFCCCGKDFADELAYSVDLLVSGGKGVC